MILNSRFKKLIIDKISLPENTEKRIIKEYKDILESGIEGFQIFGLIEQNDFENVKKIVPISYDAQRDRNNLLDFYKLFEDKSKERDDS